MDSNSIFIIVALLGVVIAIIVFGSSSFKMKKQLEDEQEIQIHADDPKPTVEQDKCPYCKGEIEPGVMKCKHCGEWLDEAHIKKEEQVRDAQIQTGGFAKMFGLFIGVSLILGVLFRSCNH